MFTAFAVLTESLFRKFYFQYIPHSNMREKNDRWPTSTVETHTPPSILILLSNTAQILVMKLVNNVNI